MQQQAQELRIKTLRNEQSSLQRRNAELEGLIQMLRDERQEAYIEVERLRDVVDALREENDRLLCERDELLAELGR